MKLKDLLSILSILLLFSCAGTRDVLNDAPALPKREFRGAWIQCVNGQFQGMSADRMQQMLISQQVQMSPEFPETGTLNTEQGSLKQLRSMLMIIVLTLRLSAILMI